MKKKLIQILAETPAEILEGAAGGFERAEKALSCQPAVKGVRAFWRNLGPGLVTGAADDDPSGIATYSQAGASFGYKFLWLAPLTFPLMATVQEMCARIGMATGRGLAANIKRHYAPWVLYASTLLLFVANVLNIGADLAAMAAVAQLVFGGVHFYAFVATFAAASVLLQVFIPYARYARYLKWLTFSLLAYVLTGLLIEIDWGTVVLHTVVPQMTWNFESVLFVCAIFGTTISPYLFFWQTSQEVEEEIALGRRTVAQRRRETSGEEVKKMRLDVWWGMFLSNLVMFFIIMVCAATLNAAGIDSIQTAADAAQALRPLAGSWASLLFALGIVGTGLLAIPVLAGSAAYALSESFGWREGLSRTLRQAHAFYGVIIIAVAVGALINFFHLDPIKALLYAAVANGLVAPIVLALIVGIGGSRAVMGQWTNSRLQSFIGWLTFGVMVVVAAAVLILFF